MKKTIHSILFLFLLFFVLLVPKMITAQERILEFFGLPSSGLVLVPIPGDYASGSIMEAKCEEISFSSLYISDHTFEKKSGWLVCKFPKNLVEESQKKILKVNFHPGSEQKITPKITKTIKIETPAWKTVMQADRQAGFPSKIEFASGFVLHPVTWKDRIHDADRSPDNSKFLGSWNLSWDKKADLKLVAENDLCSVVRQHIRYVNRQGNTPPSQPEAVYLWFFFKNTTGNVFVRFQGHQKTEHPWKECRFFEFHVDTGLLTNWQGFDHQKKNEKKYQGRFSDKQERIEFDRGILLHEKEEGIIIDGYQGTVYGDRHNHQIYLHPLSRDAWKGWKDKNIERDLWFRIGQITDPALTGTPDRLQPRYFRWISSGSNWKEKANEIVRWNGRNDLEQKTHYLESADLALVLHQYREEKGSSLSFGSLVDKRTEFFYSGKEQALFRIHLRCGEKEHQLSSLSSWNRIERTKTGWRFSDPADEPDCAGLSVDLKVLADPQKPGMEWSLDLHPGSDKVRLLEADVASLSLDNFGPEMVALYPGASGTLVQDPVRNADLSKIYPSLWATMGWMAAWDKTRKIGFYIANHDPNGAYKTISMKGSSENGILDLQFKQFLPFDPKHPESMVSCPGKIVWKTFVGDWFDAALIYRNWVRENAPWFPKLGPEGRIDMPEWMKKLCLWGRLFGYAKDVVPRSLEFQKKMGIPIGIHWYVWHQIPFDNDYPHYFPAKEGFVEGVQDLRRTGKIRVIPYINGRCWDTHDKLNQDDQFTAKGKAGACKKENGSLYTELYLGKEIDGSRVVSAVMCPASNVWKMKINELIQRLIDECGLDGVYMDQIAAASPCLCWDPSHGHPLYGGSWWVEGYRDLLQTARKKIPDDRIFASECNAETYVNLIHGMVCWHIAGNDVPAWSTIYSGTVFPYGRAYDSNTRAMKMKWAQNLVFGDQPGWFPASFLNDPAKLNYLRPLVRFRYHMIPYFYKGEAARPLELRDPVPTWTENWNLFGKVSYCTMPVVQTGVRRILDYDYDSNGNRIWSSERLRSVLLIFTNFSDEDTESRIDIRWNELGINPDSILIAHIDSEGNRTSLSIEDLKKKIVFPKNQTWGIELRVK